MEASPQQSTQHTRRSDRKTPVLTLSETNEQVAQKQKLKSPKLNHRLAAGQNAETGNRSTYL